MEKAKTACKILSCPGGPMKLLIIESPGIHFHMLACGFPGGSQQTSCSCWWNLQACRRTSRDQRLPQVVLPPCIFSKLLRGVRKTVSLEALLLLCRNGMRGSLMQCWACHVGAGLLLTYEIACHVDRQACTGWRRGVHVSERRRQLCCPVNRIYGTCSASAVRSSFQMSGPCTPSGVCIVPFPTEQVLLFSLASQQMSRLPVSVITQSFCLITSGFNFLGGKTLPVSIKMFLLPQRWIFENHRYVEGCEQTSWTVFEKRQRRSPALAEVPFGFSEVINLPSCSHSQEQFLLLQ